MIFFFGAAGSAKAYIDWTSKKPDFFIDNDPDKWEKELCGIVIKSKEFLQKNLNNIEKVVITCDYLNEIIPQLKKLNIEDQKIEIPPKAFLSAPVFKDYNVRKLCAEFLSKLTNMPKTEGIVTVGGSALGFCRESDFILWDGDLDLFAPKKYELEIFNYLSNIFTNPMIADGAIKGQFNYKDKIYIPFGIDLYDSDQDFYIDTYGDHKWKWPVKMFLQNEKVNIHGFSINVPSPSEEYLSGIYGERWKIPNKKFNYYNYNSGN